MLLRANVAAPHIFFSFQRNETEVGNSKRWSAIAAMDLLLNKVNFIGDAMALGITTFDIMPLSITTFSIMKLSILTLGQHDNSQHHDFQHCGTW
jgi:hypothetical protein